MRRVIRLLQSQIRFKIIIPYLLLTIVVMLAGASIALTLAAATVQDRFTNEVTRVARSTNDAIYKREQNNLRFLWEAAFAQANEAAGAPAVAEALGRGDQEPLEAALLPYYASGTRQSELEIDRLVAFDRSGTALVDWQRLPEADAQEAGPINRPGTSFGNVPGVQRVLADERDEVGDKFSGLFSFGDEGLFFYTAVPVRAGTGQATELVGGLLIAQRLDQLLTSIQDTTSRADISVVYDTEGNALESTVTGLDAAGNTVEGALASLSLDASTLQLLRAGPQGQPQPSLLSRLLGMFGEPENEWSVQTVTNFNRREYQQAFSPLTIRRTQIGYVSAGLARDFLITAWATNRNAIIAITLGLVGGAVLVGMWVARQISTPLRELVDTAEAVTAGNLQRRSHVANTDELGTLSRTFNQMTDHLLQLYQSSRELSSTIDVGHVLATAQESAQTFVPGTVALALLASRDGWHYMLAPEATPSLHMLREQPVPLTEPLLEGLVSGDQLTVADLTADAQAACLGLQATGLRSLLLTPITVKDSPAGLLLLASEQPNAFAAGAVQPVESIANIAVTVLANATLYRQVQEESRERQAILQSIADAVVVVDDRREIVLLNGEAAILLGISTDAAAQRLSFDTIVLEPIESTQDLFGRSDGPTYFRTASGGIVSRSSAPVLLDEGRPLGEVIVLHDVSAEVAVDRAKTNFIGTISHELRTPLTVVRGYLDLLVRGIGGPLNPDQTELIQGARDRAQQMTELIQNVILIADIEAGKIAVEAEPQDVELILEGVVASMRSAFASKQLELRMAIPEELPLVLADRQHLQQILRQLLDNAQRYTLKGGVVVRARQEGQSIWIDISDTGPGIAPEEQEKLFTRFHRVEGNSSVERGSGLGLAITKHLVERQGGLVRVQSEPGQGSTFSFSLPQADEHEIALAATGNPTAP